MDERLVALRWDTEYRRGRYVEEPPLPFVADILAALDASPGGRSGVGLYIGCGNGRNYVPLVDAGLRIYGLDLSLEALRQLARRRAGLPLICGDFRGFAAAGGLSYVVAIQVFQHGTLADVATYFGNVRAALRPGGLFFCRVNSASTQIVREHSVLERTLHGSLTIRYEDGPKDGLAIHFYARQELEELTAGGFETVLAPRECFIEREPPLPGFWAQWEAVWRRR